jgi:hypothetical protein
MRLMSKKYTALFCALAMSAFIGACGDDDDDGDDDAPDASHIDGGGADAAVDGGTADAGPPISGTIAVLDVKVTNNFTALGIPPLAGAAVSVTYLDESTDTGTVAVSAGAIGCTVTVYDVEAEPAQHLAPEIDEGALTVTGTASPVGQCTFLPPLKDYLCVPEGPVVLPLGTALAPSGQPGTSVVVASTIDWTTHDPVGSQVQLAGFSAANNGVFAVVAVADSSPQTPEDNDHHALVIAKTTAAVDPLATAAGAAQFITGAGPTPAQRDFLALGQEITINKAAGTHIAALTNIKITPPGAADPENDIGPFALTDASPAPEDMPTGEVPAGGYKISCDGAGGSCGSPGAGGDLDGFTVTGSTTDAVLTGAKPFEMPKAVKKFATFTCSGVGKSATITKAAWDAVLGTSPTRIETRVIKSKASLTAGGTKTRLVVGHSLIGWTDVPQGK